MITLDKTSPPPISLPDTIALYTPEIVLLDNGIPVVLVNMGTQDVVKIEIVFKAGRFYEQKKLAALITTHMLKEGSHSFSSQQIAEKVDYYGGTLANPFSLDTSSTVLYSLNKNLPHLLPVFSEVVTAPVFPQQELDTYIQNNMQRLKVELQKCDVRAYRAITELIFGAEHMYGYNSSSELYDNIKQTDVQTHFDRTHVSENAMMVVSGKVRKDTVSLLNQYLTAITKERCGSNENNVPAQMPVKKHISMPDSLQTAIRIGRRTFTRQHPDYIDMYILNTLIGGYFGSRLMTVIREEKGYTYGIYSLLDSYMYDGYFLIATEVGNDVVQATIDEIYTQIEDIRNNLVSDAELQMLRNYMLGNILSGLDGPFNVAEVIKTLQLNSIDQSMFQQLVHRIRTIQPEDLQRLAHIWLRPEDMWIVTAGR